jgi:hypothetical protein
MVRWMSSRGWDVVLLYCPLGGEEPSPEKLEVLTSAMSDVVLVHRDGAVRHQLTDPEARLALEALRGEPIPSYAAALGEDEDSLLSRHLGTIRTYCPDALIHVALTLHAAMRPQIVVANYIWMGRALPLFESHVLKVIFTHDVFSSKAEKVGLFGIDDYQISSDEEGALLRRADLLIAVQSEEATLLRAMAPAASVVTAGSDFPVKGTGVVAERRIVLMVASGNPMNAKGLRDFLRYSWPEVRKRVPDAEFWVAGAVGEVVPGTQEGVRRLGRVPDLSDVYEQSRVVINPAAAGTGLKIKTLEALSYLKPHVVWPSATDGLSPELSSLCRVATDWHEFTESVVAILESPPDAYDAQTVRETVERALHPDAVYRELASALPSPNGRTH